MSSTSESGHEQNAASFNQLITFVKGYGAAYNPSKTSLTVAAMQTLAANATTALHDVHTSLSAYGIAVAAREAAFLPLSKLTTRALSALKATDATVQVTDTARTYVRKIQGQRATPKKTELEKEAEKTEGKITKEISSSQMSYTNRLANFDQFIKYLASVPEYAPNETDLKVDYLNQLYSELSAQNESVNEAIVAVSNARIMRNQILYGPNNGLVECALDVKNYVKSVFGTSSPQYKQVSSLAFKKAK